MTFWVSGWDPETYPLEPTTTITVFVAKHRPINREAFQVIDYDAYQALVDKYAEIVIKYSDLVDKYHELKGPI